MPVSNGGQAKRLSGIFDRVPEPECLLAGDALFDKAGMLQVDKLGCEAVLEMADHATWSLAMVAAAPMSSRNGRRISRAACDAERRRAASRTTIVQLREQLRYAGHRASPRDTLASDSGDAYLPCSIWNGRVVAPRERIFNVPIVVLAIVALLGVIHAVFVLVLTQQQATEFLLLFSFIPARYGAAVLAAESWARGWGAAVWTFVTYAFIHGDLNHLFFNAIWLLAFGTPVARRFGPWRFAVFFAVTAAAGAAVHLATHFGEMAPMIGASAAVSGAMAAAMRFVFQRGGPLGLLRNRDEEAYRVPPAPLAKMLRDPRVMAFLAVWFGVNILFGLGTIAMPGVPQSVAWQAHIGGFLAGLFGFALFDPVRDSHVFVDPQGPQSQQSSH